MMKQAIRSLALVVALAAPSIANADYSLTPKIHSGVPNPSYRIALISSVRTGKSIVYLMGKFDTGLAAKLDSILTAHPEVTEIAFNSPGGLFSEGLNVGEVVSNHKLKADVPRSAICVSACAFAFLGGASYRIRGVLAFHQGFIFPQALVRMPMDQIIAASQREGAQSVLWCIANGFVYRFASIIANKTNPDRFFVFTNERQLRGYMNPSRSIDGIFGKSKRFTLFMDGSGLISLSKLLQKYGIDLGAHRYRLVEMWSQSQKGVM